MNGRWTFWVFFLLLVFFHLVLRVTLGLGAFAPDLLTIALLLASRRSRPAVASGLGFLLGLLRDALGLAAFGADAITLTVLGYLGARTRDLFEGGSLVFTAVFLFIGKWLHDVIYWFVSGALQGGGSGRALLVVAPVAALYAGLAGAVLLGAYRALVPER